MKRVIIPFDLPVFDTINSNHPLPASLVASGYEGIELVRADRDRPVVDRARVQDWARDLARQFEPYRRWVPDFDAWVEQFVQTRNLDSQAHIDPTADLAFFHTAPALLNQMPWIIHVENITTLFSPSIHHGDNEKVALRSMPAYWFVRSMLASERCRGVFTNLTMTKRQIDRVFADEAISRKTTHVPLGPCFTPDQEARIAAAVDRKRDKQEVEILFTNSWHQSGYTFFLRGGLEVVLSFLKIEAGFPQLRLILRTAIPDAIADSEIMRCVREHPKITLLEEPVSESDMLDLFMRADIFALDSASVHSISILRAMYCGAACIVSDIPGYEDYATDGETAIVVPGRRAALYSEDPDSGWLRDHFQSMYAVDNGRVATTAGLLAALCEKPELRRALGMNARRRVMTRNNFAGWRNGFEGVLRRALEPQTA